MAQTEHQFVESQIKHRHEAEEAGQKQNLREGLDEFSPWLGGRETFSSRPHELINSVSAYSHVTAERITFISLAALGIAHAGDEILHLFRRRFGH